mgnify:CR=1 FL=1
MINVVAEGKLCAQIFPNKHCTPIAISLQGNLQATPCRSPVLSDDIYSSIFKPQYKSITAYEGTQQSTNSSESRKGTCWEENVTEKKIGIIEVYLKMNRSMLIQELESLTTD